MEEKVCVIVPVKGISLEVEKCIDSILQLNYVDFEVVVVDDGVDEKALKVLDKFRSKIRFLNSSQRGPSYARNLAAKNTDARFLAFTDSDCVVEKNWLGELMKGFERYPDAVACGGRQRLPADAAKFERKVFLFMKRIGFITDYMRKVKEKGIIEVNHNPSCNVVYKRDIFLQEGGFLEGLWPGEDVELDYRLKKKGYKILFNSKAVVFHYKPKKLKDFLKMMSRYGEAQGFLVRKYGMFRKIHFLPFIEIILLLLFVRSITLNSSLIFLGFITAIGITLIFYFKFDIYLMNLAVWGSIYWFRGFLRQLYLRGAKTSNILV